MIKFLYQQLLERLDFLGKEKKKTLINDGRIAELQLVIIGVQQLLLGDLNRPYEGLSAKEHNEKMFKRFGQPEGEIVEDVSTGKSMIDMGDFSLIDDGKPNINTDLTLTEKQIEALLLLDEEKKHNIE